MYNSKAENDILKFLENLSNQEVSTPIDVVNKILDRLPQELWENENIKFLDPFTKNGEFLREITKRLFKGLSKITDPQERINHILKKQVFGIAISYLTHLISKRTLYCSLEANSKYSYAREVFDNKDGNVYFDVEAEHEYNSKGKCIVCGATREMFSNKNKENYAYWFIHNNGKVINERMREIFGEVKFDVIIGNPPYQMQDGGGTGSSATALYNKFIETAIKLEPKYISMIIPSRWFNGGKGLDEFRRKTINDRRYKEIHHYIRANECFPAVNINGGVNYFLWDKNHDGKCLFNVYENKSLISSSEKYLNENGDIILTDIIGISVINKINFFKEEKFSKLVSSRNLFNIGSDGKGLTNEPGKGKVKTYIRSLGKERFSIKYIEKSHIDNYLKKESAKKEKKDLIKLAYPNKKILIPKANGSEFYIPKPFIADARSVCSETFLVIAPSENLSYLENVFKYMNTNFFIFLLNQMKNTQNMTQQTYSAIPLLDFTKEWNDEKLYEKYKLDEKEIEYITKVVNFAKGVEESE